MGENSRIEWTEHTFNPWWGCVKISPACTHCYAESFAKRYGHDIWGPKAGRRFLSDQHWQQPTKWNATAAAAGHRARVFCASMADVFEDRRDLDPHRTRLWALIESTPHLDWLLLTKRPENIASLAPWREAWPENIWLGATVENQALANERLPHLASIPAAVRFISAEPLFGHLDLSPWLDDLDWVITGGESGARARLPNPTWFLDLSRQCARAQVAFHFKQWGEWAPHRPKLGLSGRLERAEDGTMMQRVGKHRAGRRLARQTWDGVPAPRCARAERALR